MKPSIPWRSLHQMKVLTHRVFLHKGGAGTTDPVSQEDNICLAAASRPGKTDKQATSPTAPAQQREARCQAGAPLPEQSERRTAGGSLPPATQRSGSFGRRAVKRSRCPRVTPCYAAVHHQPLAARKETSMAGIVLPNLTGMCVEAFASATIAFSLVCVTLSAHVQRYRPLSQICRQIQFVYVLFTLPSYSVSLPRGTPELISAVPEERGLPAPVEAPGPGRAKQRDVGF